MTYTKAIRHATPDAPAGGPEHLAAAIANAPEPTPAQRTAAAELAARVDAQQSAKMNFGALRVMSRVTGGTFRVERLTGPANAAARAELLSEIVGRKVPQSQAGVSALIKAVFAALGAVGNCRAAQCDDAMVRASKLYRASMQ
jgi:hypothetical protein